MILLTKRFIQTKSLLIILLRVGEVLIQRGLILSFSFLFLADELMYPAFAEHIIERQHNY